VMCALYKAVDSVYVVVTFGAVFKNNNFWTFLKSALFAMLLCYRYLQPHYDVAKTFISNYFLTR
jgi:hypothetical protein